MTKNTTNDEFFMRRCIELADLSAKNGDLPFGSVVVSPEGVIIGEGGNILQKEMAIDGHAERIALSQAQKRMGARTLEGCTLYTTVEPCPMCSFPVRELHIKRVVYGLESPVMGGHTKYHVLDDPELSDKVLNYFGKPPEIVTGVLKEDIIAGWKEKVPEVWKKLEENGVFKS